MIAIIKPPASFEWGGDMMSELQEFFLLKQGENRYCFEHIYPNKQIYLASELNDFRNFMKKNKDAEKLDE